MALALPEAWGQGAPTLASVTPARGATGIAVTSPLVFVFDQAMAPIPPSPTIPGLFVGSFEVTPDTVRYDCEWGADQRTLTCTSSDDLPASTTVAWKLNPAGALLPLSSASGTAVATTSGSFTTGTGSGGGGGGGGGGGDDVPELLSTTPANGAFGVPVTASVQFVFDRPMKKDVGLGGGAPPQLGAVGWFGEGVDASNFTYSWSADGKTLTAEYLGDFPSFGQVSWVLNSEQSTTKLQSEEGVALPEGEYSGGFITVTSGGGGGDCDPNDEFPGWGSYTLAKISNYKQVSANDLVPSDEEAFQFGAAIMPPDAGPQTTAAEVTVPPNTVKPLSGSPVGGFFFLADVKDTAQALNTAYPGGAYTLKFTQAGQAQRSFTMTMPASMPPSPMLANYDAAQAIDAAADFTVRWNAFTGATAQDSIVFSVMEGPKLVFQAPDACVPRELAPTATSIVIPARTLTAGRTYQASLSFGDVFFFSTNAVPNMAGFGSVSVTTEFVIKTSGGGTTPAAPARFTGSRMLDNDRPQMTLTGTPGRTYTLQRATRIGPGDWENAGTVVMDAAGNGTFEEPTVGGAYPRFYRAVAN